MTYPESVQFLYSLGNEVQTAKLGLERITSLLDALGNPERSLHFVHVAGTNGKGSTCAMIEAALRAGGRRTGLFTSPHLVDPVERIRIAGEPVTAEQFAAAFDRVHAVSEQLIADHAIDLHPTYFETVTAMAIVLFGEAACETVVLEVGLGGRLDATNAVTPDLCVITPVDFDHQAFLGKTIEEIAFEKAGILKAGVPAVFARQRPDAAAVLNQRAAQLSIPVARSAAWQIADLELTARGSDFLLSGERSLQIHCPLAGEHQVENAATAAIALTRLAVSDSVIQDGIARAEWPGRLEHIAGKPETILDGAHNPAGARALAAYLERFYRDRQITMIFGAMRDKAIAEITGALFPLAARVILTAPRQARAMAPAAIRDLAPPHGDLAVAAGIEEALATARDADLIVVTGSLFLVGEARGAIR